jgi:hypothetical protein
MWKFRSPLKNTTFVLLPEGKGRRTFALEKQIYFMKKIETRSCEMNLQMDMQMCMRVVSVPEFSLFFT